MECSANRRGEACLAPPRSGNRTAISVQRTVPCVMLLDVSLRGAKRRGNLAVHNWITGRPRRKRKRLLEIATAPSGPRNDKLGSLMPMNLRCMICKCTRRSLSAATDAIGVYHFNGSQYESGVHRRERHAAPLQGVCGRLPMALAERRYRQICKHARSAMPLSILAAPLPGSPRRPLASSQ